MHNAYGAKNPQLQRTKIGKLDILQYSGICWALSLQNLSLFVLKQVLSQKPPKRRSGEVCKARLYAFREKVCNFCEAAVALFFILLPCKCALRISSQKIVHNPSFFPSSNFDENQFC